MNNELKAAAQAVGAGLWTFAVFILLTLPGCGGESLSREGRGLIKDGRVEEGVDRMREAARSDPRDYSLRTGLIEQREKVVFELLTSADADLTAGRTATAEETFQRVLAMHPENPRAQAGLEAVARARRHRAEVSRAIEADSKGQAELALDLLYKVLAENPEMLEAREARREIQSKRFRQIISAPQLKSRYTQPISLEFRETGLRQVFDALAKGSGLNFIFDKEVRPDIRVSISVRDVLIENAIALLLEPNQLAGKVLNDNTLMIYPATAPKIREYQDLVIRSFYLENADVKQTQNMIKTMLKTKDTFIDEKLNLLVIRDTPDVIRLAENLISVQDHAEPEVMLEVEVMEILRSQLSQLGVQFPDKFAINSNGIIGSYTGELNLKREVGTSNLLSNPRIRVRNREKAKILIGNRIPVISSVVTPSSTTPVITDTIQYLDVGLKLEIEPNIHLDGGVMIKMNLEVSTLGDQVTSKNGTIAFRVGTRNASTVLQLKDGETQTLMGLIQDDEIEKAARLPGLGDIPVLGRLFSNTRTDGQKTEIVLSITPRIVRNIPRPPMDIAAVWSGTEAAFRVARPVLNLPDAPVPVKVASNRTAVAVGSPVAATVAAVTQAASAPPSTGDTASAVALQLSWKSPAQVKPGEEFTVSVEGSSAVALAGAELQLLFDPSALAVVSVTEGDLLRNDSAQTNFTHRSDASTGRVYAGVKRAAANGASGSGSLLAVTFKAVGKEGPTQVHVATAVPSVAGGGTLPVRGGGPLQLLVGNAGKQ
jgi:general secretion pathway protein D